MTGNTMRCCNRAGRVFDYINEGFVLEPRSDY